MKDTHALRRTSPKGGSFIGTCMKCGKTDLPGSAIQDECVNPAGLDQDEALILAIEGIKP